MKYTFITLLFAGLVACSSPEPPQVDEVKTEETKASSTKKGEHNAKYTTEEITIDGLANEAIWSEATFYPIDERWLGEAYDSADFQGSFKAVWNETTLYLLVEILDDTVVLINPNWDEKWWDNDCVEIFIDEDNSGGEHQFNHNAFAYHVLTDGNVVDLGPDKKPHLYNEHVQMKRTVNGNLSTWEFAITIYNDTFIDDQHNNETVTLTEGKDMGFALAYCDNDTSQTRENFIGTMVVEGEDKDRGWIDAGVFGTMHLVK